MSSAALWAWCLWRHQWTDGIFLSPNTVLCEVVLAPYLIVISILAMLTTYFLQPER